MTDFRALVEKLDEMHKDQIATNARLDKLASDYYGDVEAGRLGVAQMARRSYAAVKYWIVGVLGLGAAGGSAAANHDKLTGIF